VSRTGTSHDAARVVLITGEPGSGKTTLGHDLSRSMRVPFIARDDVRTGLFFSAGAWSDRPQDVPTPEQGVETFLRIVEAMAGLGVSCVVEYVIRRGRPQDLERITAVADCVVLYTMCRDPIGRFAARNNADRLLNRPSVLDALGYASIDQHTSDACERMRSVTREMRTDFELPLLRVTTDDGYDPGLEHIIDFVASARPRAW
jgi:predicted kinase